MRAPHPSLGNVARAAVCSVGPTAAACRRTREGSHETGVCIDGAVVARVVRTRRDAPMATLEQMADELDGNGDMFVEVVDVVWPPGVVSRDSSGMLAGVVVTSHVCVPCR